MPLSPHEEEQLRQIEQQLYSDKNLMKAANDPLGVRGRMAAGVVLFLFGMGTLVLAVMIPNALASIGLGVLGFAVALIGSLTGYKAYARSKTRVTLTTDVFQ